MSCVDNHISTQISIIYGSFLSRERLFWHCIDWLDISWWSIQTIGACVTPVTASNDSEGELRENWARCTKIQNWCRKVQKCVARKLFQLEQLHFVFWLSLSHCSHSWSIFSAGGDFYVIIRTFVSNSNAWRCGTPNLELAWHMYSSVNWTTIVRISNMCKPQPPLSCKSQSSAKKELTLGQSISKKQKKDRIKDLQRVKYKTWPVQIQVLLSALTVVRLKMIGGTPEVRSAKRLTL